MKIAVLTAAFPYPLDEGRKIRSFKLIEQLATTAEVHLFSLCLTAPSEEHLQKLRPLCKKISLFTHARGPVRKCFDLMKSFVTSQPYLVAANTNRELQTELAATLRKGDIDIVQLEELCICGNLPEDATTASKVLDAHNAEALVQHRIWKIMRNPIAAKFYSQQAACTATYERCAAAKMDLVICVSREDEEHFAQLTPRTVLVPNGVDAVTGPARERKPIIIFTGTLNYAPNRDAVRWFLDSIWPNIRRQAPDAEFQVIGRKPPGALVRNASAGVSFLTDVAEIEPHLQSAQVMVVPLRAGGGTRFKILQAFASGLPVVSTTIGAEGLNARDGEQLLLGDSEERFAAAVLSLLRDRPKRESLAEAAQQLVEREYLWKRIVQPCVDVYREIAP